MNHSNQLKQSEQSEQVKTFFSSWNSESTVIYYEGTFDPFHNGHKEALENAIALISPELVIVVVDEENNHFKPNKSDWNHRFEMTQLAIQSVKIPNNSDCTITVLNYLKKEVRHHLFTNFTKTWQLIGNDVMDRLLKSGYISTKISQNIIVSIRDFRDDRFISSRYQIKFVKQTNTLTFSSSTVRDIFLHKPEYFIFSFAFEISLLFDQIDSAVWDYIRKHFLYFKFSDLIHKIDDFSVNDLELVALSKSNNICLRSLSLSFFIKIFTGNDHVEQSIKERDGIICLNKLNLDLCSTTGYINLYHKIISPEKTFSFLLIPLLSLDLSDLSTDIFIASMEYDHLSILCEKCLLFGKALARLHNCKNTIFLSQIQTIVDSRMKHLEQNRDLYQKLIPFRDRLLHSPLTKVHFSFVHGDANPSNFVVDLLGQRVIFLDLGRIGTGLSCEDYFRFYYGLSWINKNNNFGISEYWIKQAQSSFEKGYKQVISYSFNPDNVDYQFFDQYWMIRSQIHNS